MKKYTLVAVGATGVTLLVCLLAALTRPALFNQPESLAAKLNWILMRPFAYQVLIPMVCTVLVALALTQRITLGMCCLLTLANLFAFGGYFAIMGGNFFKAMAWFSNAQDLILQISPVWFTAILVLGVLEKKPVVWALSALGLAMMIFLQAVVISVLANTPTAMTSLDIVTGGALVLIALLAVYDWVTREKGREALP